MADSDQVNTNTSTTSTTTNSPPGPPRDYEDDGVVDHHHIRRDPFFDTLPPGYRFCPEDYELIVHYLSPKVYGKDLPNNNIANVNIYGFNPEDLAHMYREYGEREWYFFTSRDRKYPNGKRPKRAAGGGYWKATGADRKIYHEGKVVGYRKTLVFYKGKAQCGDKTNWIMHEYRVDNVPLRQRKGPSDMILDEYILCRIYKKTDGVRARLRHREPAVAENEDEVVDDGSEAHSQLGPVIPTGHMLPTSMYSDRHGYCFMENFEPSPLIYPEMFDTNMNTINVPVSATRHPAFYFNNGSYSNSINLPNMRPMEHFGSIQSSVAPQFNPNHHGQFPFKTDQPVQDWRQSMNHEDQYLNFNNGEP